MSQKKSELASRKLKVGDLAITRFSRRVVRVRRFLGDKTDEVEVEHLGVSMTIYAPHPNRKHVAGAINYYWGSVLEPIKNPDILELVMNFG